MVSRFDIVRFHGLYRARRRCSRGRFASLIPVGLAPDIPFTRPWAAMHAPNKPSRENVLRGTILPENHILSQIKRLSGTNFLPYESSIVFPRKARQNCNYPDSPFDLRIRPLQQAPFADFAAEDLVERGHGRAGGGGFEEAEET